MDLFSQTILTMPAKKFSQDIGTMSQQLDTYNRGTAEDPIIYHQGSSSTSQPVSAPKRAPKKRANKPRVEPEIDIFSDLSRLQSQVKQSQRASRIKEKRVKDIHEGFYNPQPATVRQPVRRIVEPANKINFKFNRLASAYSGYVESYELVPPNSIFSQKAANENPKT